MSKSAITRLFVGGVVAVVAGIILATAAFLWALSAGVFVWDGQEITGVTSTGAIGGLIGFGIVAVLAMAGGAIAGLVAWIGALINTVALDDKAWFVLLLVLGLGPMTSLVALQVGLTPRDCSPSETPVRSISRPAPDARSGTGCTRAAAPRLMRDRRRRSSWIASPGLGATPNAPGQPRWSAAVRACAAPHRGDSGARRRAGGA